MSRLPRATVAWRPCAVSSPLSLTVSPWPPPSVRPCCAFPRNGAPAARSATWMWRRWRPSWPSRIARPSRGSGITPSWHSCTTRGPGLRGAGYLVRRPSASRRRRTFASWARARRNVSVRCGLKQPSAGGAPPPTAPVAPGTALCQPVWRPAGRRGGPLQAPALCPGGRTEVPSLATKRVTPHVFRHTTAVHLVAAGVDVTVIRSWLGHAHLDTTNRYAQATLETKRAALERIAPETRPGTVSPWKQDDALLAWLESL